MSDLFSLQGSIYAAVRDPVTGRPGARTWLGNATAAELALEIDKSDKLETFSGQRGLYGSLNKSKAARFTATLDEWLPTNLALGLFATEIPIASGSVVAEAFPSGLVAGDDVELAKPFVSSVVIEDSVAAPLTLGTHYSILSAAGGVIRMLDVTGFTQPFNADYSHAAATGLAMFSQVAPPERWIFFDGVNTNTNEKVIIDMYRVQFDPIASLALINEDWGGLPMSGSLLVDAINLPDSNYGGYARLRTSPAV